MKKNRNLFQGILLLVAACMLFFALFQMMNHPTQKVFEPAFSPASTQTMTHVAGVGVVEPKSEWVGVGAYVGGVVERVLVVPGQKVKKGDPLFTLDQRLVEAQINRCESGIQSALVVLEEAKSQLAFYEKVSLPQAVSREEKTKRQFDVKKAQSKIKELEEELEELKTRQNLLTVCSPLDGEVLRISIHEGEYATAGPLSTPLMILGDTSQLHVRVSVDEMDAQRVGSHQRVYGSLRGTDEKKALLTFVRIEPQLKWKSSLTNDRTELVDTRVLEIIYAFSKEDLPAYPGQQMDVFIETKEK